MSTQFPQAAGLAMPPAAPSPAMDLSAMSAPAAGPAPMFGQKFGHQPDMVTFSGRQKSQPQFSGIFTNDEGGPRVGRIAGAVVALLSTALAPFALFEKVEPTNRCAYKNTITGNVKEVDGGVIFAPWGVVKEGACWPTNDPRVTEAVRGLSSDGIMMHTPVSVAWRVPEGQVDTAYTEAYGGGGTSDKLLQYPEVRVGNTTYPGDTEGSKAQIPTDALDGIYENVMFTEVRSIIGDLQALIPASQAHTQAAKEEINNAILNGYNPRTIYEKFEDFQVTVDGVEGETNDRLNQLLSGGEKPGLAERIENRYGAPIIEITDVDARDAQILDEEYKAALQELGRYPTLQAAADQQAELNRRQGLADLEKAAAEAAVVEQLAQGEADAIRVVGEAIRQFPEALADKYAEGFKIAAENGNLIITDSDGNNPIIIDGSEFRTGGNGGEEGGN